MPRTTTRPAADTSPSTAAPAEDPVLFSVPVDEAGVPLPRPAASSTPASGEIIHTIDLTPGCGLLTDDEKAAAASETAYGPPTLPEGMDGLRARLAAVEARLSALEATR